VRFDVAGRHYRAQLRTPRSTRPPQQKAALLTNLGKLGVRANLGRAGLPAVDVSEGALARSMRIAMTTIKFIVNLSRKRRRVLNPVHSTRCLILAAMGSEAVTRR
jgi:hypothetical protein